MDSDVAVSFEISIDKTNRSFPVVVSVRSSDATSGARVIERFNEDVVEITTYSEAYGMGLGAQLGYGSLEGYSQKELKELNSAEGMEIADPYVDYKTFLTIPEAISWIKEKVEELRNYWKAQKGQYNKLVAELRELKIEDFLDENVIQEITLSQTVKIKK